uniref:Exonuclease domain-containing protein n=1 Tax=Timema bartmani TaxID=61472 RepID=A0A7R9I668_9NEOP|nr:unnamed protein product [Timema bartmani]
MYSHKLVITNLMSYQSSTQIDEINCHHRISLTGFATYNLCASPTFSMFCMIPRRCGRAKLTERLLERNAVLEMLSVDPPDVSADSRVKDSFLMKDAKANDFIVQCVADNVLEQIKNASTAKVMITSLKATYVKMGIMNRIELQKKLRNMYFEADDFQWEIIEFPCLKVASATFQVEDVFHQYVQPKLNKVLSPFCIELTGILQAFVQATGYYPRGIKDMLSRLNLKHKGRLHSGIDDCYNIANILKTIGQEGFIFEKTSQLVQVLPKIKNS